MLKSDKYTPEILRNRYNRFKDDYIELSLLKETTGLPIRHQNIPEDITENIVKFVIQNYDNDISCKWAKSIGKKGDLYSEKYLDSPPEVKAFTSGGPSSFGPKKKFGVIYFLDMRRSLIDNLFVVWKVNVSNNSSEWKQLRMSKSQTNEDQCEEGRRPHISWDNIYSQMQDKCVKIYEGTFESIFTPQTQEQVKV